MPRRNLTLAFRGLAMIDHMKRILVILRMIGCLAILLISCNDDDNEPIDPTEEQYALLTKISRNGLNQLELFYDNYRRLYRINYYFGGNLSSYNLYEYSDEGIKELRRYKADHALDYQSVFTLDNFGRIIKSENYSGPDFDKINSVVQFHYNSSDQLIRRDFSSAGNPVYSRLAYTYDDQNNLIKIQNTLYPAQPEEYVSYQIDYTPGENPIPAEWENYIFILGLSSLDEGVRNVFNDGSHFKAWNEEEETTSESSIGPSERIFDDNGNLTRQVLTTKNILKPQNADVVSEMTYEYAH